MNEAVEKVVKAGKKVLAMASMPFSSKYEAEEVWGIPNGKRIDRIQVCVGKGKWKEVYKFNKDL